jgi:CPA2 family monovalent cation:H+ antiporter-2
VEAQDLEIPILKDILLIFGLAIAVLLLCHRLRVATIVGFLVTGILAGPHGLGLISAQKEVEILAEIGVVLLLFTIGIEFSLANLIRIKRLVLLGGGLQVVITILVIAAIFTMAGAPSGQAVFLGFLASLSSTAIVLKLLQEKSEVESPHGQFTLAVLIFQDVAVVPMMLLTPFLAGTAAPSHGPVLLLVAKGISFLGLVLVSAKWVVPHLLFLIARTRSRELFLLSSLVICFAVAFLSFALGLSLALGAFMAGLIVSETEFSHETLGNIIPFRDVFTSLFFVSIGMFLDVKFLVHHPAAILSMTLAVVIVKSLFAGLGVLVLGFPIRTGIMAGLALCQVGEFSFILFMKGAEYGLLQGQFYQYFLDISVLTMGVTPFIIAAASFIADSVLKLPLPARLKRGFSSAPKMKKRITLKDHVIIVGFGFNGRNIARAAKLAGIPYVIIEMNPRTVKEEREKGEPIHYGDASQTAVLEEADLKDARVLVVVISDPIAIRRITAAARKQNPRLFVVARTRFVTEMKELYELGADEVIPEEFETSMEIFSRVLAKYLVPRDEIEKRITEARADGYRMFRTLSDASTSFSDMKLHLPDADISTLRLEEGSDFVGKSLGQIELRKKHGVTVLALRRNEKILSNPDADTVLQAGDLLIILGTPVKLANISPLLMSRESDTGAKCE